VIEPLLANLALVLPLWLLSLCRRDVSIIDLVWPLMFVLSAWIWFVSLDRNAIGWPHWVVLALVMFWGLRLHIYLAKRNLGQGEDRRYQQIRANNSPGFWWKSLFIVFLLQALLAWMVAFVIYGAFKTQHSVFFVVIGLALAVFGLLFETIADWQLAVFKKRAENSRQVLDQGLWRLTRHPNYFGECCFWWGLYLVALPSMWWVIFSPLLITILLLRVSGVSLLEKDIVERRPGYREYVATTPAFFPDLGKLLRGDK
jgi:steroid 5-alpha reductase family enzyme